MSEEQKARRLMFDGAPAAPEPMEEDSCIKPLFCPAPSWRVNRGELDISKLRSLSIGALPEHYGRKLLEEQEKK